MEQSKRNKVKMIKTKSITKLNTIKLKQTAQDQDKICELTISCFVCFFTFFIAQGIKASKKKGSKGKQHYVNILKFQDIS